MTEEEKKKFLATAAPWSRLLAAVALGGLQDPPGDHAVSSVRQYSVYPPLTCHGAEVAPLHAPSTVHILACAAPERDGVALCVCVLQHRKEKREEEEFAGTIHAKTKRFGHWFGHKAGEAKDATADGLSKATVRRRPT